MGRVCLVGAGYISNVHAEGLAAIPGVSLAAVVDPNMQAAKRLADRWGIADVYCSIEEALAQDRFDRAHVLVPPDRHRDAALPLLRAGKATLLEKPLAVSSAECRDLLEAAVPPALLGVNQNFVYHPAFVRLCEHVERRKLGNPRFVDILYNVPLRQMESRQFGHWMFRSPQNMLLEQAVHPLSQLIALCGPVDEFHAVSGAPVAIAPGISFVPSFTATFRCRLLPANMHFAVGRTFPAWQVRVTCDDGIVVADMIANRFWTTARTRWLDAVDGFVSGQRTAMAIAWDSTRNLRDYGLSMLRLKARMDGFFQSMSASVLAFHRALDAGKSPPLDGKFGALLVETCERLSDGISATLPTPGPSFPRARAAGRRSEIAVLGGTGFIGRHVVARLLQAGMSMTVLARNTANLPAEFHDDLVCVRRGDIRDGKAVEEAIAGADVVVNLAHGGGGESWEEIRDAMLGGAQCVARCCLAAGTRRLLHIGSIASLYLGPQPAPVTGATPPDPQSARRAPYARAKALCDQTLLEMRDRDSLPVCILRPGLVVGEGSSPFHSGLGFYNNAQHCIGWNQGRNPLPFVLVEDVAAAVVSARDAAGVEGRSYNLVGDVRLTAREYIAELAKALQRPLQFHPKHPLSLFLDEVCKWNIKLAGGRRSPFPSLRDIESRGLRASFDCSDAKRDLGWEPVSDRTIFVERAICVHAKTT